jgi:hypothetical protein
VVDKVALGQVSSGLLRLFLSFLQHFSFFYHVPRQATIYPGSATHTLLLLDNYGTYCASESLSFASSSSVTASKSPSLRIFPFLGADYCKLPLMHTGLTQ